METKRIQLKLHKKLNYAPKKKMKMPRPGAVLQSYMLKLLFKLKPYAYMTILSTIFAIIRPYK